MTAILKVTLKTSPRIWSGPLETNRALTPELSADRRRGSADDVVCPIRTVGLFMQVRNHRLLIPLAAVVSLLVPAAAATAAGIPAPSTETSSTPKAQKLTGVVQTVIREPGPGRDSTGNDSRTHATIGRNDATDTSKVLRVGTKTVPLTDGSLPTTPDGTTVAVTVVPSSSEAGEGQSQVVAASTIAAPTEAAVAPTHQVYVALVLPAGLAADASLTDAASRAMITRVSSYWSSQTGARVSFATARVLPTYRSAFACSGSSSDAYNMWNEALRRMPEADGPGKHLVLVAPNGADANSCAYGLGTIGAVEASGNKVFVSGLNQSLLAHELGHNLGLHHSNALRCTGSQDRPFVAPAFPGCQANPYDDLFDVMGYSGTHYGEGNLNAVHIDGMNLQPNAVRRIPAGSGVTSARITPLSTTTNYRTVKVVDSSGINYFVEYRTNTGRDMAAGLTYFRPAWGVRVLRDDPTAPRSAGSYELDATPTSLISDDYQRVIPVGGTFTSATGKLTIKVLSQDASGASLSITNRAASTVPYTVTATMPTRALVGASVVAATKVTDPYGSAVADWPVTLHRMASGTTTWQPVKSVLTTSAGMASHQFVNGQSATYRWVSSPRIGASTRLSPSVVVSSVARVVENRPAGSMPHGRYLSVSGSVSSLPLPVVYIQYRHPGGQWLTGPRAVVTGTAVSGRILLRTWATTYTRLYVAGTASYLGSFSGYYVTTVT